MKKTILITGGTGGLGQAVVKKMLDSGYKVVLATEPNAQTVSHENLEIFEVDVTNEEKCQSFVKTISAKYKHIDVALLLVGGFMMGNISQADEQALDRMLTLNFKTAYLVARPVFEQMESQSEGGKIIFIGARPALQAETGKEMLAYSLSKSLIFSLSEMLNAAGKDKNVQSTVIVPSTIDTPANRQAMPDADPASWVSPEDLANLMNFVISDTILRESILKAYKNT
ncbi:MAG: SDR family NAD(P)-dependent oxidoreductase [Verrucomicrobia bacterium]|nr:SDR family NAD(P)-dependent oxidoreductase [Cytophagales bacterium]